jgi:ring-1,2-phenylacetyl-CoA epoxidase subunit PaaA
VTTVREYPRASIHVDTPMTSEYRTTLIRLLADQARAELIAAHAYSRWVSRVADPDTKLYLAEIAKEETEHWHRALGLLGALGVPPALAQRQQTRSWFYRASRVLSLRVTWTDVALGAFLIDAAAYILVEDFAESSYAPWAEMASAILKEEEGHPDFGMRCVRALVAERGAAPVQRALRKWWRISMNLFGPPVTRNTALYIRLGLKVRTNEERRRAFRAAVEPRILAVGLAVPRLYREQYPFV